MNLDRHNERVNRCRRWMAGTLECGGAAFDLWTNRRRSDRWGRRGIAACGWRAQRIASESRSTTRDRDRAKFPRIRAWECRRDRRTITAGSALRLLDSQEYVNAYAR